MPIVHNGRIYVQFDGYHSNGARLAEVDLHTGTVLRTMDRVGDATGAFVHNGKIYSFMSNYYLPNAARMNEIDLATWQRTRTINIGNATYVEHVPFDQESGFIFVRQQDPTDRYKGRLSAYRISDGQLVWSFPASGYAGGFDDCQAPIVAGDSVFTFVCNAYWSMGGQFHQNQ